ncbi:MAG: 4-hydroxybenzoate octaprenyltransferase [Blastomonas sp.]
MTTAPLPDTETRGLLALLPAAARPYALLARFDRPIGWWLLYWPCAFALALSGGLITHWPLLAWMLLGAIAMRGAGCVYNDIVDRDLDARVARTRGRPLASGAVSLKAAWAWLLALCLIGLIVLVQLDWTAALIAVGSLALVAAYPFMKRITWWPQVWLGLVFSWGALVAWPAVTGALPIAGLLLYAGCVAWVIGYDTIYALQDVEDDALVGIRSSARAMGRAVRPGVGLFYALALALWGAAIWSARPDLLALVALLPVAGHLLWQVAGLKPSDPQDPLNRFRSNRTAGLLAFLAFATVGLAG